MTRTAVVKTMDELAYGRREATESARSQLLSLARRFRGRRLAAVTR